MAKAGRKKLLDGSEVIRRAEELFQASVEVGKPDFNYVAMAIGASPLYPPDWAIFACINLKMRTEMNPPIATQLQTPSGVNVTGKVLDDAIRTLVDFGETTKGRNEAIREAMKQNELKVSDAEIENLRHAWDREIAQSTAVWAKSEHIQDIEHPFKATRRVARVLRQLAAEQGDAELGQEDQQAAIWLAKVAGKIVIELKFSKPEPK